MKRLVAVVFLFIGFASKAQVPEGKMRMGGGNFNVGHFYGKVVDSKTGKGLDGATVQLTGNKYDSSTKKRAVGAIKAVITEANGDFSLDNLPVMGNFTLKLSAVGYKPVEQKVSFNIKMGGGMPEGGREQMMSMVDKDLGNIHLESTATELATVTVTAVKPLFEMGVDRKVFNVDKNLTSTGQSAVEVMKSIPTLSVDIDGNVTMRNATPQLFVDGRPTTMTLDQIPADIIDRVELITNPSAKFDASGGNAGILNIVLKKNRRTGYNGGIRAGVDTRGRINAGGDINFRQGKINFFSTGFFGQRKSKSTSITDRYNLYNGDTTSHIYQTGNPVNQGTFGFVRAGFDYLMDNRNTFTLSGNYNKGSFKQMDAQRVDSTMISQPVFNRVQQNSTGTFKNLGTQLSYKHLFAQAGHELTADANYNDSKNDNQNVINTQTYQSAYQFKGFPVSQKSVSNGTTKNYIFQSDYSNPITDNQKIEAGARVAIRDFDNINTQFFLDPHTNTYVLARRLSSNYSYTDKVYAAYGTYSLKKGTWSYQLGLRVESSDYNGSIINKNAAGKDSASSFSVKFPFALFPSAFITKKLSDKEDLQLNYTRRVNRPNFFQLIPFPDYSDPYNISVGNAGLKPEFANSLEVSYNNSYKRGANFLVSAFFKYNTNLITRYQYIGANPDTAAHYSGSDSVLINTYINANNSVTYGLELTNKMPITRWWDMTINFNIFNSRINLDASKQTTALQNQRTSWFVKGNNTIKFWKTWSLQISGEYFAKTVLPQEGGRSGGGGRGGGGGGGMFFGGGNLGTSQGYIGSRYSFDVGLRKDWTWKGGNSASLNLSVNDVFRTNLYRTYTESPYLVQYSERRRDPQVVRLNFSYRFGKFDINLFKRKNTKDLNTDVMTGQ